MNGSTTQQSGGIPSKPGLISWYPSDVGKSLEGWGQWVGLFRGLNHTLLIRSEPFWWFNDEIRLQCEWLQKIAIDPKAAVELELLLYFRWVQNEYAKQSCGNILTCHLDWHPFLWGSQGYQLVGAGKWKFHFRHFARGSLRAKEEGVSGRGSGVQTALILWIRCFALRHEQQWFFFHRSQQWSVWFIHHLGVSETGGSQSHHRFTVILGSWSSMTWMIWGYLGYLPMS